MSFAGRLKESRKVASLTQAKLAKAIGVTRQTIISLEDGSTKNTIHTVKLAKALNINPSWLEFGEGSIETNISLDHSEKELISLYRRLNQNDKSSVLRVLTGLNAYIYKEESGKG
jgi:DNA-binding XRE family transcriptional regulator